MRNLETSKTFRWQNASLQLRIMPPTAPVVGVDVEITGFVCLLAFTVLVCRVGTSLRWSPVVPAPNFIWISSPPYPEARLKKLVGWGGFVSSAETSFCCWQNSCVHHQNSPGRLRESERVR